MQQETETVKQRARVRGKERERKKKEEGESFKETERVRHILWATSSHTNEMFRHPAQPAAKASSSRSASQLHPSTHPTILTKRNMCIKVRLAID